MLPEELKTQAVEYARQCGLSLGEIIRGKSGDTIFNLIRVRYGVLRIPDSVCGIPVVINFLAFSVLWLLYSLFIAKYSPQRHVAFSKSTTYYGIDRKNMLQ